MPPSSKEEIISIVDERIELCRGSVMDELHQINSRLVRAFPDDEEGGPDLDGHRKYHEQMIKAAMEQERFWREMRLDLAKKGAWGLLIIILGLIITGMQLKFGLIGVPK